MAHDALVGLAGERLDVFASEHAAGAFGVGAAGGQGGGGAAEGVVEFGLGFVEVALAEGGGADAVFPEGLVAFGGDGELRVAVYYGITGERHHGTGRRGGAAGEREGGDEDGG